MTTVVICVPAGDRSVLETEIGKLVSGWTGEPVPFTDGATTWWCYDGPVPDDLTEMLRDLVEGTLGGEYAERPTRLSDVTNSLGLTQENT